MVYYNVFQEELQMLNRTSEDIDLQQIVVLLCHVKMINRHREIDLTLISSQTLEIHKSLSCDYI